MTKKDRKLGMDRDITRRDFLNGASIAIGGSLLPHQLLAQDTPAQNLPSYYPPALTGMRGSHPGSFEVGHRVRDGDSFQGVDTNETYDLVVVGGGISGLTAIAVPNALAFIVVANIGSGLTATLYALPSLATYGISVILGMETLSRKKSVGLSLGVAGCVWILSPNPAGINPDSLPWLLLGMLVPLSLAIGNVYRTSHWPKGATPEQLATGMLLAGAVLILLVVVVTGGAHSLLVSGMDLWTIVAVQSVLTAISYRGFFHLQKRTSPTFLSQLGFVITPAGLLFGIVFFGESYGWAVWGGVVLLLIGVVLANGATRERKTCNAVRNPG